MVVIPLVEVPPTLTVVTSPTDTVDRPTSMAVGNGITACLPGTAAAVTLPLPCRTSGTTPAINTASAATYTPTQRTARFDMKDPNRMLRCER